MHVCAHVCATHVHVSFQACPAHGGVWREGVGSSDFQHSKRCADLRVAQSSKLQMSARDQGGREEGVRPGSRE